MAPEQKPPRLNHCGSFCSVPRRGWPIERRKNIAQRWPAVKVVGTYSPPLGFEKDLAENAAIMQRVNAAKPDVLVVGLGAPKQELWVQRIDTS